MEKVACPLFLPLCGVGCALGAITIANRTAFVRTGRTRLPPMAMLNKTYEPRDVEDRWYAFWMDRGFFAAAETRPGPRFSIVIPPPNVTGSLTMGHVLNNTLQDIVVRYHRMRGEVTLWIPGTDHAGIATQNVVEKQLATEGLSRHDLGREHFTMDPGLSQAVREVFVRLYEKGLIYRGHRIIHWCPRCLTALSDEEAIVSKGVILPLMERPIPVIADEAVDPAFGTGAVKVTPAHDANDFDMAQRHGLAPLCIMSPAGIITAEGGAYAGLDRMDARKRIVADLEARELLVKT